MTITFNILINEQVLKILLKSDNSQKQKKYWVVFGKMGLSIKNA